MFAYARLILAPVIDPFLSGDFLPLVLRFIPLVLFFELPLLVFIILGVVKYRLQLSFEGERRPFFPSVSVIITCYSEGGEIQDTIRTVAEQLYPGRIQILAMIDGASVNKNTYEAALEMEGYVAGLKNRAFMTVPKWQRGGRVSSINTGLNFADGEIVMVVDGDTSFDNNMVERATRHFEDPSVVAVAGCLRVKNADENLVTMLQAIEYFISIQSAKTGLSSYNMVNNISGAFGIFRRGVVDLVRGWDAGTAEDLDITMRIKNYFGRSKFRIVFDPQAMGYTSVPETLRAFFRQRLRWDGDLSYIYFRKHSRSFSPRLIGWPNFFMMLLNGLFTQIALPAVIFIYTLWLFFFYPLHYAVGLALLIYLFYFMLYATVYFIFVACVSERREEDLSRAIYLPLLPLFTFATRINAVFALIWELGSRAHLDSSMAPWWVARKNKF